MNILRCVPVLAAALVLVAPLSAQAACDPLDMIYGECDEVNAGRWLQE